MKKTGYKRQHEEIGKLKVLQEVRTIEDDLDKAVYILRNYDGEVNLTQRGISDFFGLKHKQIKRRLWSTLLGYIEHGGDKPRYLAPIHETHLAELCDFKSKKMDSVTLEEFKIMVM